jgi:hypothetical protein
VLSPFDLELPEAKNIDQQLLFLRSRFHRPCLQASGARLVGTRRHFGRVSGNLGVARCAVSNLAEVLLVPRDTIRRAYREGYTIWGMLGCGGLFKMHAYEMHALRDACP